MKYYPLFLYSTVPMVSAHLYMALAKVLNDFEDHPTPVRKKNMMVVKVRSDGRRSVHGGRWACTLAVKPVGCRACSPAGASRADGLAAPYGGSASPDSRDSYMDGPRKFHVAW